MDIPEIRTRAQKAWGTHHHVNGIGDRAEACSMTVSDHILAEVAEWPGVAVTRIEHGGKHRRLFLQYGERERFVTFPCSASDHRAKLNQVRDVRKTMTELGARRNARPKATRKRERNRPDRNPLANVALAPVKANPFDALASFQFAPQPAAPREGHLRKALRLLAGSVRRIVARFRQERAQKDQSHEQL